MKDRIRPLSYSFLQKLDLGPQYLTLKEEETEYFTIGSLVDCLLTEPDKVEERFCFFTDDDITAKVKKIVDEISKKKGALTEEAILAMAKEVNYGDGWKPETIVRKVMEAGKSYYDFLQVCSTKPIVTKSQLEQAKNIVNSLLGDQYTRPKLRPPKVRWIDSYDQLKVDWTYKDVPMVSKLDKIIVNHKDATIELVDLKTTGNQTHEFRSSYFKFRYDLQSSIYTEAGKFWAEQIGLKKYTVLPFRFIVESTKFIGFPLIFECSENDLHCGKYGGYTTGGYFRKGFDQLVNEFLWHKETDMWTHSKEYVENGGKFILNAFEKVQTIT